VRKKAGSLVSVSFIITILIISSSLPYQAVAQKGGPDFIPGRYIVVLEDGVSPQDVTRGHGVVPDFVYSHALNGFSGQISPVALEELKQDPRVLLIEQDQKAYVSAQILPTGINRVDAEPVSSPSSFAGQVVVAILDTGVDYDHPDLNVVHKVDCAKRGPYNNQCYANQGDDGYGHGTHVAGTVAALDNNIGAVGVVPGADLWSIKVLGNDGSGWYSWIIAGVDYVTANANSIDVANMSLGGSKSTALNNAVENSIAAGVVYAVAAGNAAGNAANYSPASAPNAITTSAIADFDGVGGGLNDQTIVFSTCTEYTDDSFACFSNYGSVVDMAAPGVKIFSTYKDGGYATFSGTSMASPLVAGAAAKLIAESASTLSPSDVLTGLINNSINYGDPNYFSEDPDNYQEPLLYVGNTPTLDETDPVISNILSSFSSNSANITWDTDEAATSLVNYGTDHNYISSVSDANYATSHSIELNELSFSTEYHFKVTSEDLSNNSASSGDTHFTTTSLPTLVSISISPVNPSITEGSQQQFTATGTYSDETNQVLTVVTWSSLPDTVAIIDGAGLATGISAGSAIITATSGSIEGTTNLEVTTAPEDPTTVSVSSVDYGTHGGKDGLKHLDITIALLDNLGDPVSGASVSFDLFRIGVSDPVASVTDTTATDGTVTFTLNNAACGNYETDVTDVIASGLNFIDDYVDAGFNKCP